MMYLVARIHTCCHSVHTQSQALVRHRNRRCSAAAGCACCIHAHAGDSVGNLHAHAGDSVGNPPCPQCAGDSVGNLPYSQPYRNRRCSAAAGCACCIHAHATGVARIHTCCHSVHTQSQALVRRRNRRCSAAVLVACAHAHAPRRKSGHGEQIELGTTTVCHTTGPRLRQNGNGTAKTCTRSSSHAHV